MNLNRLGNTDIRISEICLGTMTWGEQNSRSDAFAQMDYAIEHGINFFDTAELVWRQYHHICNVMQSIYEL